jgi:broad specificity phosphatase PhoE
MYSPASLLNPVEYGAPQIGAPIVYVVRHAQNDDDKQGKIRGLKDLPLNEFGERQLDTVREFFRGKHVLAVITDDLSRTRQTALAVALACGCEVETDLGLRSWDLGKLEGKSMSAHKMEIQDFKAHPDKVPTAGQSWGEFKRQAYDAIGRLTRKAMEGSAPIVLVTHGSFIQVFCSEYGNFDCDGDYDHTPLEQAGIAALYLTRQGHELKILEGGNGDIDE